MDGNQFNEPLHHKNTLFIDNESLSNQHFELFDLIELEDEHDINKECDSYDNQDSHDNPSNPSEDSENQIKKRARKYNYQEYPFLEYKYRRRVSQFPRIIKRDFRRQFPLMYLNILNQNHVDLHTRFVHEFFGSNCLLKLFYQDSLMQKHCLLESQGRDYLNKHCILTMISFLDIIYLNPLIEIHRNIHSNCYQIKLTMCVMASKLYSKYGIELETIESLKQHLQKNALSIHTNLYSYDGELNYQTSITFHLNEHHHVYEFHSDFFDHKK